MRWILGASCAIIIIILAASAAGGPRAEADAYAARARADVAKAQAEQAAARAQVVFQIEAAQKRRIGEYWVVFAQDVLWFGRYAAMVVIAAAAAGLSLFLVGRAWAGARRAHTGGGYFLVRVDPATGQFPLVLDGRGNLGEPNTGAAYRLDETRQPDPQAIAAANLTRALQTVARQAAGHRADPAGVASVSAPVVAPFDADDSDRRYGRDP